MCPRLTYSGKSSLRILGNCSGGFSLRSHSVIEIASLETAERGMCESVKARAGVYVRRGAQLLHGQPLQACAE
jgi:hypothetical protein